MCSLSKWPKLYNHQPAEVLSIAQCLESYIAESLTMTHHNKNHAWRCPQAGIKGNLATAFKAWRPLEDVALAQNDWGGPFHTKNLDTPYWLLVYRIGLSSISTKITRFDHDFLPSLRKGWSMGSRAHTDLCHPWSAICMHEPWLMAGFTASSIGWYEFYLYQPMYI